MIWADMVELSLDEDDFGDFEIEGLFAKSFTPSESITTTSLVTRAI